MAWVFLVFAGLLEIVWAVSMKKSAGFSLPLPTAVTVVAMLGSLALLAAAMKTLPLGTAYVIWTGIGAIGSFAIGIIVLGEAATPLRLTAAALILAGLLLMKISGGH